MILGMGHFDRFRPRSRLGRAGVAIGYAIAALELTYVVAVAVFLSTPLFRMTLNLDPNDLALTFGFGWSVVPGFIHLHHVHLDGQDPNVHWNVQIPYALAHISLAELREKKVHIVHLSSPGGLTFKLHLKTPAEHAAYPQTPDTTTLAQKRSEHWQLKFENVDLYRVESLEVANWIYRGGAEIHGGFALWPGLEVEVGPPAHLDFQSGSLASTEMTKDARPLLDHLVGTVDLHLEKFLPYQVQGSQVLKYLDVDAKGAADISSADWLNQTLIHRSNIWMTDGDGKLAFESHVHQGKAEAGSHLEVDSERLRLRLGHVSASGRGTFRAQVQAGDTGEALVELSHFKVEDSDNGHVIGSGPKLEGRLSSPDLELASFFSRRTFELSVPEATTEGEDNWATFLGSSAKAFSVKPGAGLVSVRLFAWDGLEKAPADSRKGYLHVSLPNLQAGYSDATYHGPFALNADISPYDLKTSEGWLRSLKWEAKDGTWNFPAVPATGADADRLDHWWWSGQVASLHLHFASKFSVEGDVSLELKDDEPVIKFYRLKNDVAGWKAGMLKQGPVKVSSFLWKSKDELGLQRILLHAGPIGAQGNLTFSESDTYGQLLLHYGILSLGVRLSHGQTDTKILPSQKWLDGT